LSHKEKCEFVTGSKMDGAGGQTDTERQGPHVLSHSWKQPNKELIDLDGSRTVISKDWREPGRGKGGRRTDGCDQYTLCAYMEISC
jgi:hypothetical protein